MQNNASTAVGQVVPAAWGRDAHYISCKLEDNKKVSCDLHGNWVPVTDPAQWITLEDALRRPWRTGFVIRPPYVGIDLDACRNPVTGEVTQFAAWVLAALPGAYVEASQSGRGLHIICRADLPAGHACRSARRWPGFEIYSTDRYLMLGQHLSGSPDAELGAQVRGVMVALELRLEPEKLVDLEDGRDESWIGPEDDDTLIALMCDQGGRTKGQMFEGRPTVAALWQMDPPTLRRCYGEQSERGFDWSAVEVALMWHLSYFTGRDRARMVRLFQRWPGYREEKHDRRGGDLIRRAMGKGVGNPGIYRNQRYAPAAAPGAPAAAVGVGELGDYVAFLPDNTVYHRPTGAFWPVSSIDARLPPVVVGTKPGGVGDVTVKASKWLARNAAVTQRTWWPGMPEIVEGYVILDGEMIEAPGQRVLNSYRAPSPPMGNPADVKPWLDHVAMLYPEHWWHLVRWMAFVAQNPAVKVNYAIVLGGGQRIGKDTILAPLERVVGKWNRSSETPEVILRSDFTEYLQCRYLIINEMKDTGQGTAFQLYNRLKTIIAAPPATHKINPKGESKYVIPNLNATIMTTNYQTGGMYLPADDGRHFVVWSEAVRTKIGDDYYRQLWGWLSNGGLENCAAYLMSLGIGDFDPSSPPEKTRAFWDMVESSQGDEAGDLHDVIAKVSGDTFTLEQLAGTAMFECRNDTLASWLRNNANGTKIKRMLTDIGCVKHPNPNDTQRGRWLVNGKLVTLYRKPG